MKSFSQFIAESRMTSHKEIVDAIAGHKKAGEIVNPVFQDLGSQARRVFGKDAEEGRDMILKVMHSGDGSQNRDNDIGDLYYAWPHDSFQSLGKFEKVLLKVEKMNKKGMATVVKTGKELLADWKPIADDLKLLKSKVVKTTTKRAEAKQVEAKATEAKFNDASSLVKVLESHLGEYKEAAKKRAEDFIKTKLDYLEKHDWDLNKAVPRATGYGSTYKATQAQRSIYSAITKAKTPNPRVGQPDTREPNQQINKASADMLNSVSKARRTATEISCTR